MVTTIESMEQCIQDIRTLCDDLEQYLKELGVEEGAAPSSTIDLYVPWLTQRDNSIRNDCGEACVAMVTDWFSRGATQPSVDDVVWVSGKVGDNYSSFANLMQALAYYGIPHTLHSPYGSTAPAMEPSLLIDTINSGKPAIILVKYEFLPDDRTSNPFFDGYHFMVACGWDLVNDCFLINDPYASTRSPVGEGWRVPLQSINAAMGAYSTQENAHYQALVIG